MLRWHALQMVVVPLQRSIPSLAYTLLSAGTLVTRTLILRQHAMHPHKAVYVLRLASYVRDLTQACPRQ